MGSPFDTIDEQLDEIVLVAKQAIATSKGREDRALRWTLYLCLAVMVIDMWQACAVLRTVQRIEAQLAAVGQCQ